MNIFTGEHPFYSKGKPGEMPEWIIGQEIAGIYVPESLSCIEIKFKSGKWLRFDCLVDKHYTEGAVVMTAIDFDKKNTPFKIFDYLKTKQ